MLASIDDGLFPTLTCDIPLRSAHAGHPQRLPPGVPPGGSHMRAVVESHGSVTLEIFATNPATGAFHSITVVMTDLQASCLRAALEWRPPQ